MECEGELGEALYGESMAHHGQSSRVPTGVAVAVKGEALELSVALVGVV